MELVTQTPPSTFPCNLSNFGVARRVLNSSCCADDVTREGAMTAYTSQSYRIVSHHRMGLLSRFCCALTEFCPGFQKGRVPVR